MAALEHGAVDFLAKPDQRIAGNLELWGVQVAEKIRIAAKAKLGRQAEVASPILRGITVDPQSIVAIGSSTGGTEALRRINAAASQRPRYRHRPAYACWIYPLLRPAS